MNSSKPLNDLRNLLEQLPDIDKKAVEGVQLKTAHAQDVGSTEGMRSLLYWLAGWQGNPAPSLNEAHICVLASSYEGVDNPDSALDFIASASKGKTPVNHLCKDRGVGLRVLEMAPSMPHVPGNHWKEAECMAATAFGMEATASGGDLLALTATAPGGDDISRSVIEKIKAEITKDTIDSNIDALDMMRMHGGREIAGLVGALVASRSRRLPVLVEGWSAIAALHIIKSVNPRAAEHVQVASVSNKQQLDYIAELGKKPILGILQDVGIGCGLAIAISCLSSLLYLSK